MVTTPAFSNAYYMLPQCTEGGDYRAKLRITAAKGLPQVSTNTLELIKADIGHDYFVLQVTSPFLLDLTLSRELRVLYYC